MRKWVTAILVVLTITAALTYVLRSLPLAVFTADALPEYDKDGITVKYKPIDTLWGKIPADALDADGTLYWFDRHHSDVKVGKTAKITFLRTKPPDPKGTRNPRFRYRVRLRSTYDAGVINHPDMPGA